MKYRLVYTQRVIKDTGKLEPDIKQRIGKSLLRYEENALKYAEKLTDSRLGTYRFRVGDYRVIFDLEQNEIVVLRIGHRRNIYKKG